MSLFAALRQHQTRQNTSKNNLLCVFLTSSISSFLPFPISALHTFRINHLHISSTFHSGFRCSSSSSPPSSQLLVTELPRVAITPVGPQSAPRWMGSGDNTQVMSEPRRVTQRGWLRRELGWRDGGRGERQGRGRKEGRKDNKVD